MLSKLFKRLLYWRTNHVSNRTFLIIASIMVGCVSALAAVILKTFVHWLHGIPLYFSQISSNHLWFIYMPLAGILISVILTRFFFKGHLEKGLGSILFAVSRKKAIIDSDKMYSHVITSGVTIGLGGSAGLEAPIVITGSAIGSNIARALNLGYKERVLLLACGAASGIAAVFNSPIAGVIFAIEVLLTEISIPVFIPLLISTATSIIISKAIYKGQLFYLVTNDWYYNAIPFYILLGGLCGLLSVYMTRVTLNLERFFTKQRNIYVKALLGGTSLGVLILLFPPLYGEGYDTVKDLLAGSYGALLNFSFFDVFKDNPWIILIVTVFVIILKVVASSFTTGSGGNGGIFAPSLFTGALTGFGLAFFINTIGFGHLHIGNFIVVGMAGILSGVVHAPLTAIFLIAEITGGYVLFVPLMIVSALSYFISKYFEPYSIYTKRLAQRGQLPSVDKDYDILNLLRIDDLIETDFIPLKSSGTLKSLVDAFKVSSRNIYPVVDNDNKLLGVIYLQTVKKLMFRKELYQQIIISEITDTNIVVIDRSDSMKSAMQKFEETGLSSIPVTDGSKYIGFISRSSIFSNYRRLLKQSVSLF
ncbi:MAG TPA: chloride channel protein [Bacteroidales bacterium]